MSEITLNRSDATQWLSQFNESDKDRAAKLLALVKLVSSDLLREKIVEILEERLVSGAKPIAIFNESERRKWKGQPNRLFKVKTKANPIRKGKKVVRAFGNAGPPLVPRQRYLDEEIGSEGVMASIITQFRKTCRKDVILSPGPDIFRSKGIRRFILVTDFIGSGERIEKYLDSAWKVGSVRSWWSRRGTAGLHFEVVAYSGTDEGIARVEKHACRPHVFVETRCPTIRTTFLPAEAALMEDLCARYASPNTEPLGFSKIGALIAFGHGMPNNAPALFWKSTSRSQALFPERTTISGRSPFRVISIETREKERLELAANIGVAAPPIVPLDVESIVLSTLRRSPRSVEAISGRLGLELTRVQTAFDQLRMRGWIDQRQRLTERGRLAVKRLTRSESTVTLPNHDKKLYFPKSLRMPRNV